MRDQRDDVWLPDGDMSGWSCRCRPPSSMMEMQMEHANERRASEPAESTRLLEGWRLAGFIPLLRAGQE
jgi:hypothetical protein